MTLNKFLFSLQDNYKIDNLKYLIDFGVDEEKSSHYGLYMLGFTCATRVETKSSYGVN